MFQHPTGIVQMKIFTSDNGFGYFPETQVFAQIWQRIQTEYQHEYMYTASKAGLQFGIDVNNDDISFFWKGYNCTILEYIEQTIQNLVGLKHIPPIELKDMFNMAKE